MIRMTGIEQSKSVLWERQDHLYIILLVFATVVVDVEVDVVVDFEVDVVVVDVEVDVVVVDVDVEVDVVVDFEVDVVVVVVAFQQKCMVMRSFVSDNDNQVTFSQGDQC